MYKLYTDKKEIFKADIQLEGASLNETFCRLILEHDDKKFLIEGTVSSSGVRIPINPMRGMLEEGAQGNLVLEVIADNTYFRAWEGEFVVDASRKVTVEVTEQGEVEKADTGVSLKVNIPKSEPIMEKSTPNSKPKKKKLTEKKGVVQKETRDPAIVLKEFVTEALKGDRSLSRLKKEYLSGFEPHVQNNIMKTSLAILKRIRK